MRSLKPLHLAAGIAGIVVFVLTGQYMAIFLNGLAGMPDGPRLLYRTSHLYLMWSSLVNLLVGFYFVPATTRGASIAQGASSIMLLLGLPLLLLGFALEPKMAGIDRPFCSWANYLGIAGVVVHAIASRRTENLSAREESA